MPRRRRARYGTVRRLPSGRWQARYTDPDGIRRKAPVVFDSQREAWDWVRDAEAALRLGHWRPPEATDVSVQEYVELWLDERSDLREGTLQEYRRIAQRWFARELAGDVPIGHLPVAQMTPALIRRWHAAAGRQAYDDALARAQRDAAQVSRRTHPARRWAVANDIPVPATGRLPQPVTRAWEDAGRPDVIMRPRAVDLSAGRAAVVAAYRLLHAVFATAVEDEILDRNPCRLKGVTARAAVERVPASPVQVAAAAQASPPRFRVAVLLAAFSGLRGGELFALARRHVDLVGGSIQVERTLSELPGGVVTFGPTKTAASTRTVHLGPTLTRQLAEHLDRFAAADPDALVFTTATGRAVTRSYRSQWWGRARRAAGLPEGFRWHDLRHTGATLALTEGGATVRDLQARHGWSNSRMALHYAHATDERARMVAQRLDRVLERVMLEPDSGDAKSMPASPA